MHSLGRALFAVASLTSVAWMAAAPSAATTITYQGTNGANGGPGGAGGAGQSFLIDQDFSADPVLLLRATAGNGGTGGTPSGAGGPAGSASLDVRQTGAPASSTTYNVRTEATGGDGGVGAPPSNASLPGGAAAVGGDAHSGYRFTGTGSGDHSLFQVATGGRGGARQSSTGVAANGGAASATAVIDGTSLRSDTVSRATGGIGGGGFNGSNGGTGGAATVDDTTTQAPGFTSFFTVEGIAAGGEGGNAVGGGNAGTGGDATTTTHVDALGAVFGRSTASARGGAGGSTAFVGGSGNGGDGGDAVAHGTATGTVNQVEANATATGGAGGDAQGAGKHAGTPGTASATAHAEATDGALVIVRATENGGDGGDGFEGALASDGGSVVIENAATGSTTGQLSIQQSARGGVGGNAVALGGRGGDAHSHLLGYTTPTASNIILSSGATGGVGGRGDQGGDGGAAEASLTLEDDDATPLQISAYAEGGDGGMGNITSGDGGAASLGEVAAVSHGGGSVTVYGQVIGGDGGAFGQYLSTSGNGADIHLTNAISGSTTGDLSLSQTARAGSAGRGGGGEVGRAGSASSVLEQTGSLSHLLLESIAAAGNGAFRSAGDSAGDGADANSAATGRNLGGGVALRVAAGAGGGGTADATAQRGGAGGDATARAIASSEGVGHDVRVESGQLSGSNSATAFGGNGGSVSGFVVMPTVRIGGRGGSATSYSEGVAGGDSAVYVDDLATAGIGGRAFDPYSVVTGGDGGAATSEAFGENHGDDDVLVHAAAEAGRGGDGERSSGGAGGAANATATGRSNAGFVDVSSTALGGRGGHERTGGVAGAILDTALGGAAHAYAEATTGGAAAVRSLAEAGDSGAQAYGAAATATALGVATGGSASAEAATSYGPQLDLRVSASVPLHSWALVSAGVGADAAANAEAGVTALGLLGGGEIAHARFAAQNTQQDSAVTYSLDESLTLDLDGTLGDLRFVFSELQVEDYGFESLNMAVEVGGSELFARLFEDTTSLLTFLGDGTLTAQDLGLPAATRLDGLDLRFAFDWTSGARSSALGFDLGVLAIPEPGVAHLVMLGLCVLAARSRSTRPAA